jgi:hypothetical protein
VLTHARRNALEIGLRPCGIHDHMAVAVGERDEVPFRVDHRLLDERRALLEQPAQEMRLAGAGIALNEESGGEEFFEVEQGRFATLRHPHVDAGLHALLLCLSIRDSGPGVPWHPA